NAARGIAEFSGAMWGRWEDTESQAEGRPDAEADAVSIVTMHSSKGLESITISYSANHSILWAIIDGILGWLYVIYFALFPDDRRTETGPHPHSSLRIAVSQVPYCHFMRIARRC